MMLCGHQQLTIILMCLASVIMALFGVTMKKSAI